MTGRKTVSVRSVIVARVALMVAVVVSAMAWTGSRAAALPIDPDWAPPPTVYVPATGHTIDRLFLDLWRSGGGEFTYGNPITPEIEEKDGRVVQYYEYARFEYWPEGNEDGEIVALGAIGAELGPPPVVRRGFQGREEGRAGATAAAEARAWTRRTERDADRIARERADYRFVPETGHGVWGGFRAFWEATGEAAYLGNPISEEYEVDRTAYQVFERGKLRWREGGAVAMEPVGAMLVERHNLPTDPERRGDIPVYDEALFVAPIAQPDADAPPAVPTGGGRSIVISLGEQAMWAFEGARVVRTSYVSTGTEKFKTPPGQFFVNTKIDSQTMAGVLGGESYNVPDVPYVMYFTDRGHAIHGAYWHENFGNPMSHGCINLPLDVAEWIYGWAAVGLPVLIVE